MKLESISVAGKDANQSGVGKKFLIISISIKDAWRLGVLHVGGERLKKKQM